MPLIAGTIIDEARDMHPSFDIQTHPNKVCLRALSRWQESFLKRCLIAYPELMDDGVAEVTLPLVSFEAGAALAQVVSVQDVVVVIGEAEYPLTLLAYAARFDPQPLYAGWIINSTLYLQGKASDWAGASKLRLRYMVNPTALALPTDELILPEAARTAAVHAVAGFLAGRQISRTKGMLADPNYFRTIQQEAEEAYLESLWLVDSATTHTIRDVM